MVAFSDDTDDDDAINEIISQAKDAVVLDQISAINCSAFTDSLLPSHLESRFLKLKSFPPPHSVNPNPQSPPLSPPKPNPNQKPQLPSDSVSVSVSASSPSSQDFEPAPRTPSKRHSPSSKSFCASPSPPRKTGCFWCSPKSKKKSKENSQLLLDLGLGSFSTKQQHKILKKAMKEEEKISREAEKIVQWAKHASARISLSDIDDEFSD